MPKGSVRKAVLIDDSDIDLFIQKRFLEVYNFSDELEMYNSANEALTSLTTQEAAAPDVIFLDLNMPDADGFTFLKKFGDLPASIVSKAKIVVLTSSESNIDRSSVMDYPSVIHFITKPLKHTDIEELKTIFV